jgi:hypothetical protein
MSEHCVKVFLQAPDEQEMEEFMEAVFELTDTLSELIQENGVGEYDGEEFGAGECILYMYGSDADRLYEVIKGALLASPLARGGYVIKRYGPPEEGVREIRIEL